MPRPGRFQLATCLGSGIATVVALLLLVVYLHNGFDIILLLTVVSGFLIPVTGVIASIAPLFRAKSLGPASYIVYALAGGFYLVAGVMFISRVVNQAYQFHSHPFWKDIVVPLFIINQFIFGVSVSSGLGSLQIVAFSETRSSLPPLDEEAADLVQFYSTEYQCDEKAGSDSKPKPYILQTSDDDVHTMIESSLIKHHSSGLLFGETNWMSTTLPPLRGEIKSKSVDLRPSQGFKMPQRSLSVSFDMAKKRSVKALRQKWSHSRLSLHVIPSGSLDSKRESPSHQLKTTYTTPEALLSLIELSSSHYNDPNEIQHTSALILNLDDRHSALILNLDEYTSLDPLPESTSSMSLYTTMLSTKESFRKSKKLKINLANERMFLSNISNSLLPPFLQSGHSSISEFQRHGDSMGDPQQVFEWPQSLTNPSERHSEENSKTRYGNHSESHYESHFESHHDHPDHMPRTFEDQANNFENVVPLESPQTLRPLSSPCPLSSIPSSQSSSLLVSAVSSGTTGIITGESLDDLYQSNYSGYTYGRTSDMTKSAEQVADVTLTLDDEILLSWDNHGEIDEFAQTEFAKFSSMHDPAQPRVRSSSSELAVQSLALEPLPLQAQNILGLSVSLQNVSSTTTDFPHKDSSKWGHTASRLQNISPLKWRSNADKWQSHQDQVKDSRVLSFHNVLLTTGVLTEEEFTLSRPNLAFRNRSNSFPPPASRSVSDHSKSISIDVGVGTEHEDISDAYFSELNSDWGNAILRMSTPPAPATAFETPTGSPKHTGSSSLSPVRRFLSESPKRLRRKMSITSHQRGSSNVDLSYVRQLQSSGGHHRKQSSVVSYQTVLSSQTSINPAKRGARGRTKSSVSTNLLAAKSSAALHAAKTSVSNWEPQRDTSYQSSDNSEPSLYPEDVVGEYDREKWRTIQKLREEEKVWYC
ncbi:hypothetical protein BABINDRAFT_162305 [Babjeviella inositovora NRRL Y-12698]|uniref:Uncharacterized protein n=1 Tax=Babjeviella inositovora NRRL Y-12698 TaxID=984486 RepID=A0A1E3QNL9_9ASCO|nr:uncharacterized protein BABINDRAFT_162305 [Babjeviella inositovora NRRL Y-12698]ODQ79271.1 hypothetical protein BABINDRAFT_162305 [Babjeviella inositovora NRRL Y-12698]